MDTQQEEALAEAGAENIKEAVDTEIKQHAEETVKVAKEMVEEESNAARIAQLKDELERLETGLPNAGATIQALKDKQQKIPRRPPNMPHVTPGNPDEIALQEASKYAGALGMAPGMVPGMGMPSMAMPRGPQGPTGPQGPVGPQRQVPRPPEQQTRPNPSSIQLDPKTLIEVELVSTKKRLAEANERLALVALSDARKAKLAAEQQEAQLMVQISKHYGVQPGKNVRLIDKEKGICMIED
jgi:hypothetical protein